MTLKERMHLIECSYLQSHSTLKTAYFNIVSCLHHHSVSEIWSEVPIRFKKGFKAWILSLDLKNTVFIGADDWDHSHIQKLKDFFESLDADAER